MQIIQPHYHAIARTAQDYERMAMSGVVAVAEPAFWAGFDRHYPETFVDYFRQISEFEPTRAAQYGIRHFCWVAVNPKEAENPELSRAVLKEMPSFFPKANGVRRGRNWLSQDDQERRRNFFSSSRNGFEARSTHFDSHAAFAGQGPWHQTDTGRAAEFKCGPKSRLDRPRRRAHYPRAARRGLLGWVYALSNY